MASTTSELDSEKTILELERGLDAGGADPGAETPVRPMAEPSSPTSTLPPPSVVLTTRLSDGCSAVSNGGVAVLACLTKPNPRAGHSALKSLRPQQGVEQITQQAGSDDCGERIVKDHDPFSSKPVAGVGVADRERKKAEPEAQKNNVHH